MNRHALGPRRPHALEVANDPVGHALAWRDELALAACAGCEPAHERLGDGAADADREDSMPRLLRFIDDGLPIRDFAVGHEEEIGRLGAPEGGVRLRSALPISVPPMLASKDFANRLALVRLVLLQGRR